ncbi:hypothetical protein DVH24_019564 [Malus domestica]|uniref:Uncharacterized protein n=1 Tax=Malus domestica TaxID=3750 RepID=A0A498HZ85_MALDO|nr:hypothetical protein DVH24_019564 [Malus domestica]
MANHILSTTPILNKCLSNATTIVGYKLRLGFLSLLNQSPLAIYLSPHAVNLSDLPTSLIPLVLVASTPFM